MRRSSPIDCARRWSHRLKKRSDGYRNKTMAAMHLGDILHMLSYPQKLQRFTFWWRFTLQHGSIRHMITHVCFQKTGAWCDAGHGSHLGICANIHVWAAKSCFGWVTDLSATLKQMDIMFPNDVETATRWNAKPNDLAQSNMRTKHSISHLHGADLRIIQSQMGPVY